MAKKQRKKARRTPTARKAVKKVARGTPSPAEMSVAQLQAELKKRQKGNRALERRRDRLLAQIAEINAQISELSGHADVTPSGRVRNTQTLPDALYGVLQGRELSVTTAADAVRAAGYVSGAANFRTIVNQTLLKDKRFKKLSRGVYTAK